MNNKHKSNVCTCGTCTTNEVKPQIYNKYNPSISYYDIKVRNKSCIAIKIFDLPIKIFDLIDIKICKTNQLNLFGEEEVIITYNLKKGYRLSARDIFSNKFASILAYLNNPRGFTLELYHHTIKRVA